MAGSLKSWSHPKLWEVYAVLWLLGAYLEYLKLSVTRLRATDRAGYLAQLRGLSLGDGVYNRVVIGAGTASLIGPIATAGMGGKSALSERHLLGGDCLA